MAEIAIDCGCKVHTEDRNNTHGSRPHLHYCEQHAAADAARVADLHAFLSEHFTAYDRKVMDDPKNEFAMGVRQGIEDVMNWLAANALAHALPAEAERPLRKHPRGDGTFGLWAGNQEIAICGAEMFADMLVTQYDWLLGWKQRAERAEAALREHQKAAPLCEEHKPHGGTRSGCLVCGLIAQSRALSEIDYLLGPPNEMHVSEYDLSYNAEAVVQRMRKHRERVARVVEALPESVTRVVAEWLLAALTDAGEQA